MLPGVIPCPMLVFRDFTTPGVRRNFVMVRHGSTVVVHVVVQCHGSNVMVHVMVQL